MSWSFDDTRRHLGRVAFSALLFGAVVVLGQVPFGAPVEDAFLRLALRTTEARIEICRDRTHAELEALPAHMRQPQICDWHIVPHRLLVRRGAETVLDRVLEPAGARSDRPLAFDEQIALAPGTAELAISFEPAEAVIASASGALAVALAEAPRHAISRTIELQAGRIVLVRLDGDGGTLVIDG
ncbi:MAG: hypothetical protein GY719_22045 [bacterium]|nr:hypothetical protein [bacterium]